MTADVCRKICHAFVYQAVLGRNAWVLSELGKKDEKQEVHAGDKGRRTWNHDRWN